MVVNIQYCQLSNRLVIIAHAMATAIAHRRGLLITVFDDLKDKYVCEVRWGGRVIMRKSIFWAIEKKLWGGWRRVVGWKRFPGVISDWKYRDGESVKKYHDMLTPFFMPKPEVVQYALEFEKQHFLKNKVMIGVHVRRGDYASWKGGRYYYDDKTYMEVMKDLWEEFCEGGVCFVVFSNDITCDRLLEKCRKEGLPVVQSKGNAFDDHYLMSHCDYLVGPPSTFTLWASWFGKVPYAHIQGPNHRPKISEFEWNWAC